MRHSKSIKLGLIFCWVLIILVYLEMVVMPKKVNIYQTLTYTASSAGEIGVGWGGTFLSPNGGHGLIVEGEAIGKW